MPSTTSAKSPRKLFLLALALGLVLFCAPAAFARKATVHYFVVPQSMMGPQFAHLNDFLEQTAGGYTLVPSVGGTKDGAGSLAGQRNWTYTVAADRNLSKEIIDYLKTECGLERVFMLVWEAERPGE
jgi:hypothetical protein